MLVKQLVADTVGNYYVAGITQSPSRYPTIVRVGADSISFPYPSGRGSATQIFVAKLNPAGRLLWSATTNSVATAVKGLAVDPAGNVYIAGQFLGSIDMGPNLSFTNDQHAPYEEGFVARLDGNGQWQWARRVGGRDAQGTSNTLEGMAVDRAGNLAVLVTGRNALFDTLTVAPSGNAATAFLGQFDAFGRFVRATAVVATYGARGRGIAFDPAGDLLLTGSFNSPTAQFGTTTLTSQGAKDIFVAKLSAGGQWQWANAAGGPQQDEGVALACNSPNTIALAGQQEGTTNFGLGGLHDVVVAHLSNATGQWLSGQPTGTAFATATALAVAPDGAALVAYNSNVYGWFMSQNLLNQGGSDGFLAYWPSPASSQSPWATTLGSPSDEYLQSIAAPTPNHLLLAGTFNGTSLTVGTETLTNPGGTDSFVAHAGAPLGITPDLAALNSLWPNPAHEVAHLVVNPPASLQSVPVHIIDALGRTVRTYPQITASHFELDLRGLRPGLYTVRYGNITRRLVVE